MSLLSVEYFIFLATTMLAFHSLSSSRHKVLLLSMASVIFYGLFSIKLFFLLLWLILFSFFLAQRISRKGKRSLTFAIFVLITPFFFIKTYLSLGPLLPFKIENFIFPLGISFFTFQIISYLLDVYRKRIEPVTDFTLYFLHISFFPQLVAGPIERAEDLLPQFQFQKIVGIQDFQKGGGYLLQGIFKKVVIANTLELVITPVFEDPYQYNGFALIGSVYLARLYIFYDFSGYTDLALGSARLFGIQLTNNFNRPFSARSLSDYWRRWHISLSNWIKDYVYYPLILSPLGVLGPRAVLILTFITLGLWHHFSINLILYGICQGAIIALSSITERWRKKQALRFNLNRSSFLPFFQVSFTFFISVGLPTVLFMSKSFDHALYIYRNFFITLIKWPPSTTAGLFKPLTTLQLSGLIFCLLSFELFQWQRDKWETAWNDRKIHPFFQFLFCFMVFIIILIFGVFEENQEFLYYAF